MKKVIVCALLSIGILGANASFAQDAAKPAPKKSEKKEMKADKKEMKADKAANSDKPKKAEKKEVKADKKEVKK
jgi:Ni/Co efflux regulator RcnB